MDTSADNSSDSVSVEMHMLAAAKFPAEFLVSDPSQILNGGLSSNGLPENNMTNDMPFVVITEQPQQRGFRFRYECEGPSHGGLQGEKTERSRKTHPSIKVGNHDGPAYIQVSLVTDETPPKPHAHKLVGKNCTDGICKLNVESTANPISFANLCVLHVTRKKASEVLMNRILEEVKMEKKIQIGNTTFEPNITAEESMNAKKQATDQARNMSLNVVRLCFDVYLPDHNGQYVLRLSPVYSHPIYDSKSPGASALKICRMDKYGGCCTGNEEVFLLCEKVQKEDISVRFVEHNDDGSVKWEAYGNFSPLDVHRQYAIVFKTPAYYNANIDKAVNVMIMLQRKTDAEVSEAKAFTYYPQNRGMLQFCHIRQLELLCLVTFISGNCAS